MRTCAFCPHSAKLSAEHILGKWMNQLFVGRMKGKYFDGAGRRREWESEEIDWTARVVCETCNNTWMSNLESQHAKPVLTPLIKGEEVASIGASEAHSLALFTFKTAVILDYAHRRSSEPFFSSRVRYAFCKHLVIPTHTKMWLGGFLGHRGKIGLHSVYHSGELAPTQPVSMYVVTCAIGCVVLQLLHVKHFGTVSFLPLPGFERSAISFWPQVPPKLVWPFPENLSTESQFVAFGDRWQSIAPLGGPLGQ